MKTTLLKKSPQWLIISILLLSLYSCIDDKYDIDKMSTQMQLTPEVAIPLANTEFSLGQLLQKMDSTSILKANKNGDLYIEYNDSLYSLKASSLINIPDQNLPLQTIDNPSDVPFPLAITKIAVPPLTFNFNLNFDNGASFDSIDIKSGNIKIDFTSLLPNTGSIEYSFPTLKKGNVPLKKNINITAHAGNFNNSTTELLDGYILSLNKKSISITVKFTLNRNSNETLIKQGAIGSIKISLNNMKFHKAYGNCGTYNILNQSSTLGIDIFNNAFLNNIELKDPLFEVVTKNSFGTGLNMTLSNVSAVTPSGTIPIKFGSNGVLNNNSFSVAINSPTVQHQGDIVTDTNKIVKSKTTLFSILTQNASDLNYTFNAVTQLKPAGSGTDFILDESTISIFTRFYSLVNFKTLNPVSQPDTIALDFSNMKSSLDNLKSAQILLDIQNQFPITITIDSIVAVNNLYKPLLKLFTNKVISTVTKPTEFVSMDSNTILNSDIEKLKLGKYLLVYIKVNTSGTDYVQLNNKDKMKMFFKIKAQAKIGL